MKIYINSSFLMLLSFFIKINAQSYDLPPNPEPGKCYVKCFYYDKEVEWKEVECSSFSEVKKEKTKKELIKSEQEKIKLVKYQEKLKSIGFDVDITGFTDDKTLTAHHKYLKIKRKEERQRKKNKMHNSK